MGFFTLFCGYFTEKNMTFRRLFLIAGIAFALLSCVEPVDLTGFVDNMPDPPVGLNFDFEVRDETHKLQLSADDKGVWWTELKREDEVPIESPKIIQVMDQSSFAGIEWYCDSPTALTEKQGVRRRADNSEWLIITPGTAPFTNAKTYQMVVVGTKNGQKFGTSVFIKVVGNSP
jgi:hypothetical protein